MTNIAPLPEQARASTGVEGLDHILRYRRQVLALKSFFATRRLGQALQDFEGVMTGVASYKGRTPLLGETWLAGRA